MKKENITNTLIQYNNSNYNLKTNDLRQDYHPALRGIVQELLFFLSSHLERKMFRCHAIVKVRDLKDLHHDLSFAYEDFSLYLDLKPTLV